MTEHEICELYRGAKNKYAQIQILEELSGRKRLDIIKILLQNGEKMPQKVFDRLFKRLDTLEAQISEREKEYRAIVEVIKLGGQRE